MPKQEFTVDQAMYMAGADRDDDPWVRDVKFAAWVKSVKARVVESRDQVDPSDSAVEVLIIKGK